MLKHVMTVYGYGYDIDAIAYDVDKSEDEVIQMIQKFKKDNSSKSGRNYSDELQSVIINRFKSGVSAFLISKELGVGKVVITKLLTKNGIEVPKKTRRKANKTYAVIEHDNFLKCPDCGSEKVNDLNSCYWDEESEDDGKHKKKNKKSKPHSYCSNCGTEWYAEQIDKIVRKDKNGKKTVEYIFETRKVLFHELSDEDDE